MENKYKSLSEFRREFPSEFGFLYHKGLVNKLCEDMGWEPMKIKGPNTTIRKPKGYWSKELCIEDALKYNSKTEWIKNSQTASKTSKVNGWFEECTAHMTSFYKPKGYWNFERCMQEALKYKIRKEWVKNSGTSYNSSVKNGWLYDCIAHMTQSRNKPNGYWTLERCQEEALKHKTKSEWDKNSSSSYQAAKKYGWFEKCIAHMIEVYKPIDYWTKEKCLEEASKYQTITQWTTDSSGSYKSARFNDWVDECTKHMIKIQKPVGYWCDKKLCLEEALKYKTKTEWMTGSNSAYKSAKKYGWIEECTTHMIEIYKPIGYWTKEQCIEEALKYKTRNEWKRKNSSSYTKAGKNGWVEECTKHMKKNGK